MTESKAEVMIRTRKVRGERCVFQKTLFADQGHPRACQPTKGIGAVQMLKNEVELRCQRRCPRELLQMVFADIAAWNTKLLRHRAKLAKMSSVTWQQIATRRLYRAKNPDTSRLLGLEHDESIQYVGRHHDCENRHTFFNHNG